MRDIIIASIHGAYRSWTNLLKQIAYQPEDDRLFLIGDHFNYGDGDTFSSGPHATYLTIKDLKTQYPTRVFVIKGWVDWQLSYAISTNERTFIDTCIGKGCAPIWDDFKDNNEPINSLAMDIDLLMLESYETTNYICTSGFLPQEGLDACINKTYSFSYIMENSVYNDYMGKLNIASPWCTEYYRYLLPSHGDKSNIGPLLFTTNQIVELEYYKTYQLSNDFPLGTINIHTGLGQFRRNRNSGYTLTAMVIENNDVVFYNQPI